MKLLEADKKLGIGTFFTPLEWAKWLLKEFHIFDAWLEGSTVCDPTAGTGSFMEAFIALAHENKIRVTDKMLQRLYAVEKEECYLHQFMERIEHSYGISFPRENYLVSDIILSNPGWKADILVGNPPWLNFTDLPAEYKEKIKPYFIEYRLVNNPQKLLLGSSRIDIAALIISMTISENLNKNGNAYFFVPLSVFLNEGAHNNFRRGISKNTTFSVREIYDFRDYKVFDDVSTRYGVAHFQRDSKNSFPIKYKIKSNDIWETNLASPIRSEDSPFSIFKNQGHLARFNHAAPIEIAQSSKPRQGVNSCGANELFIFEHISKNKDGTATVVAKNGKKVLLPEQFLFPLVSAENFKEEKPVPKRYILLPYNPMAGKPLTEEELKKYPLLWKYLYSNKEKLVNRKGVLINTWIKKNLWWALLGVGEYSFAPYKVVWEAYGRKSFYAKLFSNYESKPWQGNQALHAYIPCSIKQEAEKVRDQLNGPLTQTYLQTFKMEGTCSWAQPSKIERLLKYKEPQLTMAL